MSARTSLRISRLRSDFCKACLFFVLYLNEHSHFTIVTFIKLNLLLSYVTKGAKWIYNKLLWRLFGIFSFRAKGRLHDVAFCGYFRMILDHCWKFSFMICTKFALNPDIISQIASQKKWHIKNNFCDIFFYKNVKNISCFFVHFFILYGMFVCGHVMAVNSTNMKSSSSFLFC